MKRIILGFAIGVVVMIGVGIPTFNHQESALTDLELRVDNLEEEITAYVMHTVLTEPKNLFIMLEDSPEWEVIDAVPYSRCYRHLIGTTTADYIFCMAI